MSEDSLSRYDPQRDDDPRQRPTEFVALTALLEHDRPRKDAQAKTPC